LDIGASCSSWFPIRPRKPEKLIARWSVISDVVNRGHPREDGAMQGTRTFAVIAAGVAAAVAASVWGITEASHDGDRAAEVAFAISIALGAVSVAAAAAGAAISASAKRRRRLEYEARKVATEMLELTLLSTAEHHAKRIRPRAEVLLRMAEGLENDLLRAELYGEAEKLANARRELMDALDYDGPFTVGEDE
jgi:hypothetical protein